MVKRKEGKTINVIIKGEVKVIGLKINEEVI